MIIKTGDADGQISGALSTTGDTLRPALQIIKCAPGITCVSGAMLLITNQKQFGEDGVVVLGDVAVTPNPTADQLAQIAYTTAQTAHSVAGFAEPRVAMMSFLTKGSAKDAKDKATGKSVYIIDKVVDATKLAKEKYPDLKVDGELRPMQPSFRLLPRRKLQAATSPDMPTCSSLRTSRWETSATSSCSAWAVQWPSVLSCRV